MAEVFSQRLGVGVHIVAIGVSVEDNNAPSRFGVAGFRHFEAPPRNPSRSLSASFELVILKDGTMSLSFFCSHLETEWLKKNSQ